MVLSQQATTHSELLRRVQRLLMERFDSRTAISFLDRATEGEIYIVGGALRRALFGDRLSGDVDIMVPNGDPRAFEALKALKVPFVRNSNRHHRYRWNSLQIDLYQPGEFFRGFQDVEAALCFFDLKINALSLHLRTSRVLDPFRVISTKPVTDPGINWTRWMEMSPLNIVVLAMRLAKIMHELQGLTLSPLDEQRLLADVVPAIRECDWRTVQQRFPQGKAAFLEVFKTTVLERESTRRRAEVPRGDAA
jgi:hypothetical protein